MSRFDPRFEAESISRGLADDLQEEWGQTMLWYLYDAAATSIDPVYDVGHEDDGRTWKTPLRLPVITTHRAHGPRDIRQGLYSTDTINLVVSLDQAAQVGLEDLVENTDAHFRDRFVFSGAVWSPRAIDIRGLVDNIYVTMIVSGDQVNTEELVNDVTFQAYAS